MQDNRSRIARATAGAVRSPALVAVLAAAVAGWVYWSLLAHVRSALPDDPDVALFVWSMEHAPHRILHGQTPFFSDVIFATTGGANLAYNATAPALAIMMYPVTVWLGPVAAVNILTWLTPVLNSLAARRLLRIVSGRTGAGVTAGALVIGFSPLVLMHNGGRFQVAFIAVVLLVFAQAWQIGDAWMCGRAVSLRSLLAFGALAGLQLWIGTELLAIAVLVIVVVFFVALTHRVLTKTLNVVGPSRHDLVAFGTGVGVFLLVASPFLVAFTFGAERYPDSYHVAARPLFGIRVANTITPTEVTLIDLHLPIQVDRDQLGVFADEDTGYVSIAGVALAVVVAASWRRRDALQRGALVTLGLVWLLSLGPTIRWSGSGSGPPGPWRLVEKVPLFTEIVANRMSLGVFVALGVLLASVSRLRPVTALAVAAGALVVLLLPARFDDTRPVSRSADALLRRECSGALVVTVPQEQEQEGMAWQARAGLAFDLLRGFAFRGSSLPKGDYLVLDEVAKQGSPTSDDAARAIDELRARGVGCVVTSSSNDVVGAVSSVLGEPLVAGDVAVWTLVGEPAVGGGG